MSKLDEYKRSKKITELGLPKMWIVHSDRHDINEPIEVQVTEIIKNTARRVSPKPEIWVHRYKMDVPPYSIEIYENETNGFEIGYRTGFGDLFEWSYYASLIKEDAYEYFEREKQCGR